MDPNFFTPIPDFDPYFQSSPNPMNWDFVHESLLYQDFSWLDEIDSGLDFIHHPNHVPVQKEEQQEEAVGEKPSSDTLIAGPKVEFEVLTSWKDESGVESGAPRDGNILMGWTRSQKRVSRKKVRKNEERISLQVLSRYFAGSLKDAAKEIGVCPTTLKRICRHHGIKRWPSRKIRKVDQSLKKLQRVIDSVHGGGAQPCSVRIDSFYLAFPELHNNSSSNNNNKASSEEEPCEDSNQGRILEKVVVPDPTASNFATRFRVKARFGEENVRVVMDPSWGLMELMQEIGKRFGMRDVELGFMTFKYLDEDGDWVHLTCDDDLQDCKEIHSFSHRNSIDLQT